jgi:hypothetical protein
MLLAFVFAVLAPLSYQSGALTATAKSSQPPSELAPPVAALLSPDGVSVSAPQPAATLDFWWVKSLPLKGSGGAAPSWQDVEEGTLVGAVRISADYRDIRGRVIRAGVYTLRYGIQPSNGDHLGVSPFRDFLLLSPAAVDKEPAATGHDGTIELSKQAIGGSHPGVWSIDPPAATEPALQLHKTELGHDAVIMQVPTSRGGQSGAPLKFGLVLVGKIEA